MENQNCKYDGDCAAIVRSMHKHIIKIENENSRLKKSIEMEKQKSDLLVSVGDHCLKQIRSIYNQKLADLIYKYEGNTPKAVLRLVDNSLG